VANQKSENHLSFHTLMTYSNDNLNDAERKEVETHLAACSDCQSELALVRRIVGAMRGEDLVTPSSSLIDRILTAFRRKQARLPERPHRRATLQFDSWTKLAPLGVRGTPQERQILFSEDEYDLDLQIARDVESDTFVLRGQILDGEAQPYGLEGIELCLSSSCIDRYGLTDTLGRFSFSQLSQGDYSLQVILEDQDIFVEPVYIADSWTS